MTAATRTHVQDLVGDHLTADADRVDRLITRAERTVAGAMPGFRFGHVAAQAVTLEADGDDVLRLPYYPVRSVTSVTVGGTALGADEYTTNVLGDMRRRANDLADPSSYGAWARWPDRGTIIVVTYDYGYAASATYVAGTADGPADDIVPDVIRDVVAELAAGRILNPAQVAQESLGDRSMSYGAGGATTDELSGAQRHRLRHWRRDRVGTIRVRS